MASSGGTTGGTLAPTGGGGVGLFSTSGTSSGLPPQSLLISGGPNSTSIPLRVAFKDALRRMLLMHPPEDAFDPRSNLPSQSVAANKPEFGPVLWKVLIYDSVTRDILSSLFPVTDLRDLCITVHMALHSAREPIADVPALYFVMPTPENISRIASDVSARLYDVFHLNFAASLPRHMLESLAQSLSTSNTAPLVAAVHDQYLAYSVVDENLFALGPVIEKCGLLRLLHSPKTTEAAIDSVVDRIASSLFGVCSTLGHVPVLRFPRGNAAELVARKLDSKLRDFLLTTSSSATPSSLYAARPPSSAATSSNRQTQHPRGGSGDGSSAFARPSQNRAVLLLLDRHIDYAVMLSHTWIYSALVQDVLDFKLNRVALTTEENGKLVQKSFDIDTNDFFWSKYAELPFPDVAANVDIELKKYKQETQDLLSITGATSIEEMTTVESTLNAKQLKSAITKLPALTAKKKVIDAHMQIATAILAAIKARSLDVLYEMQQQKLLRQPVLDLMKNSALHVDDKLRLLSLYYLAATPESSSGAASVSIGASYSSAGTSSTEAAASQAIDDALAMASAAAIPDTIVRPVLKHLREIRGAQSRASAVSAAGAGSVSTSTAGSSSTASTASSFGTSMGIATSDLRGRLTKFTGSLLSQGNIGSAYETIVGGVKQLLERHTGVLQKLAAVLDGVPAASAAGGNVGGFGSSATLGSSSTGGVGGDDDPLLELDPRSSGRVFGTSASFSGTARTSHGANGSGTGGSMSSTSISTGPVILFIMGGGNYAEYQSVMAFAKSRKRHVIYGTTELLNASQFLEQIASIDTDIKV